VNVGSVGEQSHKSEMGAALRGDFERLRARRGAGEAVLRAPRPGAEPVATAVENFREPAPIPVTAPPVERASVAAADEPVLVAPRGSWLDRLRGRR
jgi:hypothetical protein